MHDILLPAGLTHGQIIQAVTTGKALTLANNFPPALKTFVNSCCNQDPTRRPVFKAVVEQLEELQQDGL